MTEQAKPPAYKSGGKRRLGNETFRYRHRKAIGITVSVLLVLTAAAGAYLYSLNSKFGNITRTGKNTILEKNRPDPDAGKALNILLLGTDVGEGEAGGNTDGKSIKDDVRSSAHDWPDGKYRSDTIMIVHIAADRKSAQLVSIPRDALLPLHDETGAYKYTGKANAAFSFYGPNGARATVEQLTDVRMKHMVMVDWVGFRDLSTALGGVKIYVPETMYDPSQKRGWKKGWHKLKGARALSYVRTRYGLKDGDFDRIKRQQNFIRATMKQLMDKGTLTNPVRLNNVLEALTENLIVDAEWETGDIRALALSMRGLKAEDVTFLTVPSACCGTSPEAGSYVSVKEEQAKELFQALKDDDMTAYLEKYPDEKLAKDVN